MTSELSLMIVIPVYNHGKTLRDVVTRARKIHDAVMVIDDGSTDGGARSLEGLDIHLITHHRNLGKGAAILTAAREARKLGMTHIVTIDADGQHDPIDFYRFIPIITQDKNAIIIGKRDFENAKVPRHSRIGLNISNFWFWVHTGQTVKDMLSGFRAYPLFIFEKLDLQDQRYSFEIEVLVKAAWAGIRILEKDISVFYPPSEERISHFRMFTDNLRLSYLNFRLFLKLMTGARRGGVDLRFGCCLNVIRKVYAIDYTEWRKNLWKGKTVREISAEAMAYRKGMPEP